MNGVPLGRRLAASEHASEPGLDRSRAGEARGLLHRDRGHRRGRRRGVLRPARAPDRARARARRLGRAPRQRRDLHGVRHRDAARPRRQARRHTASSPAARSTRCSRPWSRRRRRRCSTRCSPRRRRAGRDGNTSESLHTEVDRAGSCCEAHGDRALSEEVRIPVRDGSHLAATLYLPDPSVGPQPCLIEALPYRKDDLTSSYAESYRTLCVRARLRRVPDRRARHRVLAGRPARRVPGGRADRPVRRDRLDSPTQEWCDGQVGMWGTSYSGFNSLQIACERPPALKAICAIYATDDRWTDDVHWRGRRPAAGRPRRLRPLHDADVRPPARAGGLGRGVVRRVAAAPGDLRAVGADLAAGEPPRCLLGPRVGAAGRHDPGLRADRVSGDDRRRLGRRLPQQLLPHRRRARPARRTASPPGRAVGARRPVHRDARAHGSTSTPSWSAGSTTGCAVRARTRTAATSSSVRRPARRSTSTCTRAGGSPCRPCRR